MRDTERQKLKQKLIQNNMPQFIVYGKCFQFGFIMDI